MATTVPIGGDKFVNVLYEIPEKWLSPEYFRLGSVVFKRLSDGTTRIVGHLEEVGQVGDLSKMAFPSGLPPALCFGNMVVSGLNLGLTAFTLLRTERNFQRLFKELELHRQLLIEIKALVTEVLEEMEMQHKASIQSALDLIRHAMNSREDSVAKGYLVEAKATLNKERQYFTMKSGKVAGNAFLVDLNILRMLYLTGLAEAQVEMRLGNYDNAIDVMEGANKVIHAHTEAMLKPLIGPHPAWWLTQLDAEEMKALMNALGVDQFIDDLKTLRERWPVPMETESRLKEAEFLSPFVALSLLIFSPWLAGGAAVLGKVVLPEVRKRLLEVDRSQWRSHLNYLAGLSRATSIEDRPNTVWNCMRATMGQVFSYNKDGKPTWTRAGSVSLILGIVEARNRFTSLRQLLSQHPDLVRFLLENGLKEEDKLVVLDLEC